MPDAKVSDKISRRTALRTLLAATGSTVTLPVLGSVGAWSPLQKSGNYEFKFFNREEPETLATLCEHIIPADTHSPGARAARVEEFIDEIVMVSEESVKKLWKQGLAALEEKALRRHGQRFLQCKEEQQLALLREISENEKAPSTLEERFFVGLKNATIDGYYNSEIGILRELEFQGNTARDFPDCTHEEHKTK